MLKHPKINLHVESPRGSALHLAAKAGYFKICQLLLLDDPTLLQIKDSLGQTVLDVATNPHVRDLINKYATFESENVTLKFDVDRQGSEGQKKN